MGEPQFREIGPDEVRRRQPEFVHLYRLVYAEPPYRETPDDVAAFAETLLDDVQKPGFSLIAADRVPDGLFGYAYGFSFQPGQWWRFRDDRPEHIAAVEKFAVREWAVHPDHRGNRIGATLMNLL